ncbi:MAG: YbjN domain-containing protein [Candidatus Melainabacteria bacterium]|nr:YbjN domain-containing protein [Candidatus Melainabacteria bacterium]
MFGTQKLTQGAASDAVTMVEQYFRRRGLDPQTHALRDAQGYGWWLSEGSAKIYVFVQVSQHGAVLRITSPLVYLPDSNREPFYRKLLDLNSSLSSCALSTHDEIVLVVAQRPTFGLVQEELDDLVWHVAYVADLLDNKLAEEFGCRMYTDQQAQSLG